MIHSGPPRFSRFAFLLLFAAALSLGLPWSPLRTADSSGVSAATDPCMAQTSHWAADPAPFEPLPRGDLPPLRAVTYNLHSGLGSAWRPFASRGEVEKNLRAIARRIAEAAPAGSPVDVVGLNEVDFGSRRSGWIDQADFLAAELKALTGHAYRIVRGETWQRQVPGLEVRFGNAVLARHPVAGQDARALGSSCSEKPGRSANPLTPFMGEARGVVRATIDFHGRPVDVLTTHLEAFVMGQREAQAAEILRRHVRPGVSTVLLGDINAVPSAMTVRRRFFADDRTHDILTSGRLIDARVRLAARTGAQDLASWATYPAGAPEWPLDGVLATADLLPQAAGVIGGRESDHRGLAVLYRWLDEAGAARQNLWHEAMRRRQLQRILACDLSTPEGGLARRTEWLASATGFADIFPVLVPSSKASSAIR